MQPFLLFTIIRLFLYIYSLYFCLYFVFSFVFYLFFYTFVCSLLTLCLFTLCLCTCEPVKTILIVSLPTCHSLHTSTLQHLINRISNFDIFLVLGRAGPDFVGLTSLSIYSITFWNLDRARRDFVGLTSF